MHYINKERVRLCRGIAFLAAQQLLAPILELSNMDSEEKKTA